MIEKIFSSVINEMNICDGIKSLFIHLEKNGREQSKKSCKRKSDEIGAIMLFHILKYLAE